MCVCEDEERSLGVEERNGMRVCVPGGGIEQRTLRWDAIRVWRVSVRMGKVRGSAMTKECLRGENEELYL